MTRHPPTPPLFPYPPLSRPPDPRRQPPRRGCRDSINPRLPTTSITIRVGGLDYAVEYKSRENIEDCDRHDPPPRSDYLTNLDRKSTRLNSSHSQISYAVFCL